ncbi:hypothetical protein SAMN05661093_08269 [Kibdelosporangium aridum]|uniref:Uncharacterized protein n=1 Tax=Kibdelosporangium aridum TaxID=2030 RepID=A0A1W2FPR4_KIBAR|nr:hypothetical protein SAMN05661093_08269 [Kibdelosporangium aridum]
MWGVRSYEGAAVTFEEFAEARTPGLLRYATVLTCDPHLVPFSPEAFAELGLVTGDSAAQYDERDLLLRDIAALPRKQRVS